MISDVGKTIASIKLIDGTIVNFFNKQIESGENNFYDEFGNLRYKIVPDQSDFSQRYRCAHYSYSYSQSYIKRANETNMVINLSDTNLTNASQGGCIAKPLYQFISPAINKLGIDEYQLSWWSNVDNSASLTSQYDSSLIKRFSYNDLANVEQNPSAAKILCTAQVRWQNLAFGSVDNQAYLTPVIVSIVITAVIKGQGYVTDFSTGGSGGGGIGMHAHTSMQDGGFAAAVFMPSANMRVLNWR